MRNGQEAGESLTRAHLFADEIQFYTPSFKVRDISQMRGESGTMAYQNVAVRPSSALDAIEEVANMIARHPVALVALLLHR